MTLDIYIVMVVVSRELNRFADSLQLNDIVEFAQSSWNKFHFSDVENLRLSLKSDITKSQPFSLLRLGDGEGNVLLWGNRRNDYPELSELCMKKIWILMFGYWSENPSNWDDIAKDMSQAIVNAKYLGLHPPLRLKKFLDKASNVEEVESLDHRGCAGLFGVWDHMQTRNGFSASDLVVTDCWIHAKIIDFYCDLISAAGNISLITCYEGLIELLFKRTGVSHGENFLIPPQAANVKGKPEGLHYPDRFIQISGQLSGADLSGRLFFVAAGLLGKIYCDQIRQSGGMAIDFGSMADVLMGQGVRRYQNAQFVSQYRLSKAP